ncbi:hypothetical protein [Actibacterium lipolyticum]|uniref:DNA alkylation repair protein n=1 Tax=Actibacterium lipolyticum TaxID=1524263 RepID=A0A238JU49_9RHOB|nr:hypothetical protein [Actibacterium lipolyticum]SMX34171.1 hypothetical protein COL8621_01202 [Actibacterium lipolyticum]
MTEERFSLKDHLFNRERVQYLAGLFQASAPSFDAALFTDQVMADLAPLELKQRITLIAEVLERHLPREFDQAAGAITAALPPPLDPTKTDDDFGSFIFAPLGEYVVRNGLSERHFATSIALLKELTQRFSVEYAIRHFLNAFPAETMAELAQWARDDHYHVRRLVSEGTRPQLPWGKKISLSVMAPLPLLDVLHADGTRFVTRSVANHLNDIAKTNPALVIATLEGWHALERQQPEELNWMTRHALRTLIKQGEPNAMALLGYSTDPAVVAGPVEMNARSVKIGESVEFEITLKATEDAPLIVDFVIDLVKSNGSSAPKVYKLKQLEMQAGQSITLRKRHKFVKGATTFTYYPGAHSLHIQLNGKRVATGHFDLVD